MRRGLDEVGYGQHDPSGVEAEHAQLGRVVVIDKRDGRAHLHARQDQPVAIDQLHLVAAQADALSYERAAQFAHLQAERAGGRCTCTNGGIRDVERAGLDLHLQEEEGSERPGEASEIADVPYNDPISKQKSTRKRQYEQPGSKKAKKDLGRPRKTKIGDQKVSASENEASRVTYW